MVGVNKQILLDELQYYELMRLSTVITIKSLISIKK